jgi:N-methylhydantoinase A
MMACFLCREIGMLHVVVPPTPGVLSALGGLIADIKCDFIATVFVDLQDAAMARIRETFDALEATALRWLRDEQGYDGPYDFVYSADMRYQGQSYEIETTLDQAVIRRGDVGAISHAFHERHLQIYEHADPQAPVQIINLRLVIVGRGAKPQFAAAPEHRQPAVAREQRRVFIDGAERDVPVFARKDLTAGRFFTAPAIVTQSDCTTCIPAGFAGRVDRYGNLILSFDGAAA